MKTLIVLIGGICLLSTSVKAQSVEKKHAKIERKNVVVAKKVPVKLTKKHRYFFKIYHCKKGRKENYKEYSCY